MTHGIRKVNEYLISNGRALIFTDNIDFSSDIDIWNSIANGSIYVNPEEGTLKYKKFNYFLYIKGNMTYAERYI